MDNNYLNLNLEAKEYLNEMSIIDSDADINKILLELVETDDSNIEIKKQTLEEIKKLIIIKNKIKVKNDNLYFLRNLSEKLKKLDDVKEFKIKEDELNTLFNIIKNNY